MEIVQRPMVAYELTVPTPSSTTLLYHTLVQDDAVPPGFQHEFESLASAIVGGTAHESRKRQQVRQSSMRPSSFLHGRRNSSTKSGPRSQRLISWCRQPTVRPRKYRARYLRAQFQGPSARKDAEESERNRWTTELADLLRGTQSPMGQFLTAQTGNQLRGGGRRASTLRSRVRGVKRFLSWLALRYELIYSTVLSQLTEHLQVRLPRALQPRLPQRFPSLDGVPGGHGRGVATRPVH